MSAGVISLSVDQAAATTATLIAAVTGKKIEVLGFSLAVFGGIGTVKSTLQDETSNTVRMTLVGSATVPTVFTYDGGRKLPAFTIAVGEGLELVTGAAVTITGFINYRFVP